jgi:hypothetical protein
VGLAVVKVGDGEAQTRILGKGGHAGVPVYGVRGGLLPHLGVRHDEVQVTVFVDDCLGTTIKEHLEAMGLDVVLHADRFGPGTEDLEWIPVVAREGWIVLTRDRAIKRRKLERQAVIEGPLKYFSIGSSNSALPTHVKVVGNHLVSIRALAQFMPAPFIATMTRQELRFMWLGDPNPTAHASRAPLPGA